MTRSASGRSRTSIPRPVSTKSFSRSSPQYQNDPTALSKIYIPGPNGAKVPLSTFAHFVSKVEALVDQPSGPVSGRDPVVQPRARLLDRPGGRRDPARCRTACVCPERSTAPFRGRLRLSKASLSSTPLLVAAAILVVYIVLGMLYESYIHPITILSALPSAGVGALLALMILRLRSERDRDDRRHPADRHRQEERDHDDRLRAASRTRSRARARRRRSTRPASCGSGRS